MTVKVGDKVYFMANILDPELVLENRLLDYGESDILGNC